MPVPHPDDPRTDRGGLRVVRDHDDRLVILLVQLAEHIKHDLRIFRVEISGRLVGQDYSGIVDDRPCQSDALLFAAGKLQRLVRHFVFELEQPQNLATSFRIAAIAGMDFFGELQISLSRQGRKQIEPLKDKADLSPADVRPLGRPKLSKDLLRRSEYFRSSGSAIRPKGEEALISRSPTAP